VVLVVQEVLVVVVVDLEGDFLQILRVFWDYRGNYWGV